MTISTAVAVPPSPSKLDKPEMLWRYYLLFFMSGFPALLYQIVWQRVLFSIYGVNIESVTVIVTVFMLGLGIGSLAGGRLSTVSGIRALRAFGLIEFSIGVFGVNSLWLFHRLAQFTGGASIMATGAIAFLLLLVPTLLMGSTLPLLVAHLVRRTANVGESVGSLYAANTFGSGAACLLASLFLMRALGESGSVRLAASLNFLVGVVALLLAFRRGRELEIRASEDGASIASEQNTIPIWAGMALAGATGFIALAYEILWYRIYSFTSGGTASSFASLLAFYLFGIGYGSFAVRDICRHKLKNHLGMTLQVGSSVVILGAIFAFLVGPAVSLSVSYVHLSYQVTLAFVAVAAALLGAAFPILSHAAIGPTERAGRDLSYLYLSNIVGSALGSFVFGFVVLDHWSTGAASLMLLALGCVLALILAGFALPVRPTGILVGGIVACAVLAVLSPRLFSGMYERLLFKDTYTARTRFANLVENRSGVIAVDSDETVYGGGVYDGHFNIDPVHDTNAIFRAYAIAGLHPAPKKVLVIGLSSGSWAQIVANDPRVEEMTIVEINPGYLSLIRQRPEVASLLQNPKVHIVIDDGRRWLVSHRDEKFDFILMNTTFNWRANVSNLLSVEFLQIIRQHLNVGGVAYYNMTSSAEVVATALKVFPYVLRIASFIAVSDSPIELDREGLKSILSSYRIDGHLVFDPSSPAYQERLRLIVSIPQITLDDSERAFSIEDRTSLLKRVAGQRVITDDNMGTEWK
jgi:spermidine synthase